MGSHDPIHVGDVVDPTVTEPAVCETHGAYEQRVTKIMTATFRSPCPQCHAEQKERQEREDRERKAWERKRNLDYRLGSAAIPKRFVDKSFDDYQADSEGQARALKVCKEYVDYFADHFNAGRCLMLLGRPGTGKTQYLSYLANLLEMDYTISGITNETLDFGKTDAGVLKERTITIQPTRRIIKQTTIKTAIRIKVKQ